MWQIFKASMLQVIMLISLLFLIKASPARSVILLFGPVSFSLIWFKEELLRVWSRTELGQSQLKRRLILVGTKQDSARLMHELEESGSDSIESRCWSST